MRKGSLAALLAGTALVLTMAAAEARELRLGHNAAPGNPKDAGAIFFKDRLAEISDGELTVQVGGNSQFGDDVEMLTALRLGTLDMSINSQGPLAGIVPESAVFGLPFLFEDHAAAWKVLDGPLGDELAAKSLEQQMVLVAYWDNGIRQISNNVRPIEAPEDLRGLKIRTPQDPATIDTFSTLGANPTPMQFSELYIALQQGVVDGQENPLMNIYSSKLFEVQKFISMSGHKYEMTPFLVSQLTWDTLSEEEQGWIRQAAIEARDYERELSRDSDSELRGKMEEAGVAFNEVDPEPFREATAPVYDKWEKDYGDFVSRVREAATATE
ncbi:TRAP transporter substrate-binding protein [Marinivivus vitaminiproducens]|uniref:TRAP transporter substrate-binding protein n=1 Tax=Marinivivus vitaminiproducens TaxID=3035935 RepID=UPI0027990312|nr:TRAP transporter substrate-binding protein [Geminicoccaceae bacterium SCSIO 64248]